MSVTEKKLLLSKIPVALEVPDQMGGSTAAVLHGEYESGYFGDHLFVLDIGANVGSFAVWANMRWPQSTIHAYEPHPETFKILVRNVEALPNVRCHDEAVYPSADASAPFYSRYAGDGESGLLDCMSKTFETLPRERIFPVPLIHPRKLPKCDVIKIDVEGAEASILEHMDLAEVSVIVLEYQNLDNRRRIEELLKVDFVREFEDGTSWDLLLPGSEYRTDLAGDRFGHMVFANKRRNRLRKIATNALFADGQSLRQLLAALPGATNRALVRRLRRLPSAFRGMARASWSTRR
jgi:FkbM family methyltransferase